SPRGALPKLLSAAVTRAGLVRRAPRDSHLGRRRSSDLRTFRGNSAAVPQSSTKNAAVVGGRIVCATNPSSEHLSRGVLQPLAPAMDGPGTAGRAKAAGCHPDLCAWHDPANHDAKLGGMGAVLAHAILCYLCDGTVSARNVGMAGWDRREAAGI